MRKIGFGILFVLMIFLVSCSGGGGSESDGSGGSSSSAAGAEKFSNADYDVLSNEQKYAVTNKMMATLYKGTPAKDFFDLSQGIDSMASENNLNFTVSMI
jgi:hypothetical protein